MYISIYRKIAAIDIIDKLLFRPGDNSTSTIWFIETNPKKVKNISLISTKSPSLIGKSANTGICNGAWDLYKKPYNKHVLFKTTTDIIEGKEFEETLIFSKVRKKRITHSEAIKICEKLRRLTEKLQDNGYKSQYELGKLDKTQKLGNYHIPKHEMVVGLDRHGELIRLIGGRHRLAVAQHIGIKRMTAILSLVHSNSLDYLPEKRREITGNAEDFRPF